MFKLLFVAFSCFAGLCRAFPAKSGSEGCFRAAILDQVPEVDPISAFKSIDLNLDLFERSSELAKQHEADIIVFAEGGLSGGLAGRKDVLKYGEPVPEHKTQFCNTTFASTNPILNRLGCIAKQHHMYVVANMIDLQPCVKSDKVKCPQDGMYAFNTAVMLSRDGVLLAKYHKIHLFGEMDLDPSLHEDLVVVDTEIGRLGLQICFDMLHATPGHVMARKHMIDTMLFPTGWVDESPFLSASQYQMGWAFAHRVNLLAADMHRPRVSKHGSGIYAGATRQFETVNYLDTKTRLLVASLPIKPSHANCPLNATTLEMSQQSPLNAHAKFVYRRVNMDLDNSTLMKIDPVKTHHEACHNGLCCKLDYQLDMATFDKHDQFYLIASNRSKPGPYAWGEEFCALIHCLDRSSHVCGLIRSDHPLKSSFVYVHLEGQFSANTTVYPSVIGSQHEVMKQDNALWEYHTAAEAASGHAHVNKQTVVINVRDKTRHKSYPLGTVGLYGRAYNRDPPYRQIDLSPFLRGRLISED